MLDRVRNMVRAGEHAGQAGSQRRFRTRREKEAFQRRVLYVVTAIAAVAVAVTLIGGAIYQFVLVPREVYATVNGEEIRREEYVKRRTYDILQEITALSQQIQNAQEGQRAQLQQELELLQLELQDLDNGDRNIDPDALKTMVEDQLVLQSLDDFGIQISDADIDEFINELLAPIALNTPTPSPTLESTPAAWATETTEAIFDQATASAEESATAAAESATDEAESDEQDGDATTTPADEDDATAEPTGTEALEEPTAESEDEATPTEAGAVEPDEDATAAATQTEEPGEDDGEATPTVEPTATLSRNDAIGTAEANFDLLDSNFLERADMSRGDFERLVARPALARQLVREELASRVESRQDQVRASHILVATQEAAEELISGRLQEEDFADVAREVSTDTGTAENGGDLGWFPSGVMSEPFEEVAFSLEPGEMTEEPVQTEFGWHIILVTDREEDRPLTASMLNSVRRAAFDNWLQEQFENAEIDSDVPLPADDQPTSPLGAPPGAGLP